MEILSRVLRRALSLTVLFYFRLVGAVLIPNSQRSLGLNYTRIIAVDFIGFHNQHTCEDNKVIEHSFHSA